MPLDLSALPLGDFPPLVLFFAAALGLAALACLALMFSGGGVQRRLKAAEDAARGLKAEIKSLSAERDNAKSEHGLADQNFRFIADRIGLNTFETDEEKKTFIDAVGQFARNGEVAGLLAVRKVELESALGMSGQELADMVTFRNHVDPEWIRQPAKAAKTLDVLASRLAAIGQMETIWRDKTANVAEARQLLADNMWVFEPDYVVSKGRLWADKSIATIAGAPDSAASKRPDIVAVTALSASLQSGHQWRDIHRTGLLVVDLKGTGTRVGADEKQKASDYARELIKTNVAKATTAIDCFVIGKEVDEDEGTPRVEGWHGNVRIVPLSYDQLITRAKRLTLDLVRILAQTPERFDDKVHTMPVDQPEPAESMDAAVDDDHHDDHHDDHDDAHHDEHHDDHDGAHAADASHDGETGPDGKPVKPAPHAAAPDAGHHPEDARKPAQRAAPTVGAARRRLAAE